MSDRTFSISYHEGLKPLEALLKGVERPGDFYVEGKLEVPMPTMNVDGVGLLSFPIPETQARALIAAATRAPYGRGPETIVDTNVRKVWQLPPGRVTMAGKSWPATFATILARVKAGLSCEQAEIKAELYKLLVYDQGGFFAPHRDTEKSDGMFGTLVVTLPSLHTGGELVLRHGGREVTVDLSDAEPAELTFAAFYADCEHEVRPIATGNRVCLVYNLIQERPKQVTSAPLSAPNYSREESAAAVQIRRSLADEGAPAKLVWLLEHQYTQASLSFAGLKNTDAALAKLLVGAAQQAGCDIHLAMVHIEESGSAESNYRSYGGYGRRRHHRESEEKDNFAIVEIHETSRYVDGWLSSTDEGAQHGKIPLAENELLPQGALDDEKPDEQRYTEASGNEGASFERAYHRAALVLWRSERIGSILLQAGVSSAFPHFERLVSKVKPGSSPATRKEAVEFAAAIIGRWEIPERPSWSRRSEEHHADRGKMLFALVRLGNTDLLERFLNGVLARDFDGSEVDALPAVARALGPTKSSQTFAALVARNMPFRPHQCVRLLEALLRSEPTLTNDPSWRAPLAHVSKAVAGGLEKIGDPNVKDADNPWWYARTPEKIDGPLVADLLAALDQLSAVELADQAVAALAARPEVYNTNTALVPALLLLNQRRLSSRAPTASWLRLWQHAAEFLLARSERAPELPTDWRQQVTIGCRCEDCRELERFAQDPQAREHRFRVAERRRAHLENAISKTKRDMVFTTERVGSPHSLICTKTREQHKSRSGQYRQDIESMRVLAGLAMQPASHLEELHRRLQAASKGNQG